MDSEKSTLDYELPTLRTGVHVRRINDGLLIFDFSDNEAGTFPISPVVFLGVFVCFVSGLALMLGLGYSARLDWYPLMKAVFLAGVGIVTISIVAMLIRRGQPTVIRVWTGGIWIDDPSWLLVRRWNYSRTHIGKISVASHDDDLTGQQVWWVEISFRHARRRAIRWGAPEVECRALAAEMEAVLCLKSAAASLLTCRTSD